MAARYSENLFTFPEGVDYYATAGGLNLSVKDRFFRYLFKKKIIGTKSYMKHCGKRVRQDFERDFGCARVDEVIQYSGYGQDVILRFSQFDGRKVIYVHSDMIEEMKSRGNQRRDVLEYAYRKYDKVANVTADILSSTRKLSGKKADLMVAKNAIPHTAIYERSLLTPMLDEDTISSMEHNDAMSFLLDESTKKFITVGRFSPEKGHERLVDAFASFARTHEDARLVIMGGSSFKGHYQLLLEHIEKIGLADKVLLLQKVSNPYAILRLCDWFVLSSFYEGFGLVLVEADIVGKPVISTDITGPRGFMQQNNGVMVENSQAGIEKGLGLLYDGKVEKLTVDYEQYNREVVEQFEDLLK
jgi:CDP-glycerol glycerophosphotransferase